jgi:hypothetical protein
MATGQGKRHGHGDAKAGARGLRVTVAKARKPSSQLVVGIITGWLAGQIVQPGSIEK